MTKGLKLLRNCGEYIARFLVIRNKEGKLIPFRLNKPQKRLYEAIRQQWEAGKPVRIIILKARQMGFSTLTEAVIFWMAATAFHVECLIVAHTEEATKKIFQMAKRFYEGLPAQIRPMQRASSARELIFDRPNRYKGKAPGLGSCIRCTTAGGEGIGRGSTLTALHLSEFAFWPKDKLDTLIGLMQAVPDRPGTMVVIESTANGFDEFKKQWDRAVAAHAAGLDGFIPIFFAWYEMDEYRREVPPGFQRTPEEEELAQTFGLDDEQLAWRRWCIEIDCGGDLNKFKQEYPATPDEAFIATGDCVFDKDLLVRRRKAVQETKWERGSFRVEYGLDGKIHTHKWQEERSGAIRILKRPEPRVPYVIGADTAGTGTDFFAAHVLDNRTGQQVAVLHHQYGERAFAEQLYCLGKYYNNALVGIEINYSTYPQLCMQELGYTKFYVRQVMDTFTGKLTDSFGFRTDKQSRPLIIDGLKDVMKYHPELVEDYDTLGEMLTFVYNAQRRPEAEVGEHDDLIMSLAIAHHIRSQQTTALLKPKRESRWTEDMLEDYRKAGREDREQMIRLWGKPGG